MLRRAGRIQRIEDGRVWVCVQSDDRCVGCAQGCALHSFGRVFGGWPKRSIGLPLPQGETLVEGMPVWLETKSQGLLQGLGLAYALPLLGLLIGSSAGRWVVDGGLIGSAAGALFGLSGAVLAARLFARRLEPEWSIQLILES